MIGARAIRRSTYRHLVAPVRSPEAILADMLPQLYALTPLEEFPQHVAEVVLTAIAGDKADYTEVDRSCGDFRVLVWPEPTQLHTLEDARREVTKQHPVLPLFLRRTPTDALLLSDFFSQIEYHRQPLYGEFFGPLGVEDQLTVGVTGPRATRVAAISVDRDSRSFSDTDRRVVNLLHPHLVRAHRNAMTYSAALSAGTPPPRDDRIGRLTDRERQVLALVAAGLDNAAIARELDISAGTVRKHIEHLLRGLGVPNRTAAAVLFARSTTIAVRPMWTADIPALLPC